MRPAEKIEKLIKKFEVDINPQKDREKLDELLQAQSQSEHPKPGTAHYIWRIIMKSRITKLSVAGLMIMAMLISINMLKGTPVWAIDQTIKALQNIDSAVAYGEFVPYNERVYDFKLYVKADTDKPYAFNGRVEADRIIGVIKDNMAYQYELGTREIYAYNLEETKGKGIGSKLWYEVTKHAPWIIPIAPTMLKAVKLMADDWQEVYKKDDITKRDCVFVTGSYQPLSASFLFVFDLESKLIVRAKYWMNSDRQGTPALNIKDIVYNFEIEDEIFDLKKTAYAKVINEEETQKRWDLWRRALELERQNQYSESIKAHQQLYERYPNFIKTPEALCQIAILYREMGQYDKAIEYFEKVPREYHAPRYAIMDACRLGGLCYMKIGRDGKALENFQNCLKLINQWDTKQSRWQKTKELVESHIAEIESKK